MLLSRSPTLVVFLRFQAIWCLALIKELTTGVPLPSFELTSVQHGLQILQVHCVYRVLCVYVSIYAAMPVAVIIYGTVAKQKTEHDSLKDSVNKAFISFLKKLYTVIHPHNSNKLLSWRHIPVVPHTSLNGHNYTAHLLKSSCTIISSSDAFVSTTFI